jgi:hypothetical protein
MDDDKDKSSGIDQPVETGSLGNAVKNLETTNLGGPQVNKPAPIPPNKQFETGEITEANISPETGTVEAEDESNRPAADPSKTYGIFLDKKAHYYAAEAPINPEDSLIISPSRNLYDTLVANLGKKVQQSLIHEAIFREGNGEVNSQ